MGCGKGGGGRQGHLTTGVPELYDYVCDYVWYVWYVWWRVVWVDDISCMTVRLCVCCAAVVASDLEPLFPGLSPDDSLTLYFTKPTNHPSVTNVSALVSFSVPLASAVRALWQSGGDAGETLYMCAHVCSSRMPQHWASSCQSVAV